jgi:transposase-like protein/IS1 family transposase
MNCPKCSCVKRVKSGIIKGRRRYKCKDCGCNYTVEVKSTGKSKLIKRQALHLYLEGLGFRAMGRILGVSNVSVLNWIHSFGKKVQELNSASQAIKLVEVDEMHTYIGSKKTPAGYGLLLIDMGIEDRCHPKVGAKENDKCPRRIVSETTAGAKRFVNFAIGDRSNKTANKFWETINQHEMKVIASDYWKPWFGTNGTYRTRLSESKAYANKSRNIYC